MSDRWSFGIVWRELSTLYRAFCRGESVALSPLPIQYGDYAVWQQQGNTEQVSDEDLSFWKEKLRGAPQLLELPADRPRPPTLSYRGAKKRFRFNPTLTNVLRDASQREKTTLYILLTAALNTLLYRYTGQEDILLGIPVADRERPELQPVIGFLIDTCVLRTELSGEMTFRDLLVGVQKGMLELYRHRAVSFDEVVREFQPERNPSYSPLFQVMINWRDRDLQLPFIGLEGLGVEPLLADSRTSKFDLTLFITDGREEIWLETEYSTDLFDEARISRMVGHYQTLLESAASDPGQQLAVLPILTPEERHKVLVEWNQTRVDYPDDMTLHQLFEAQAQRTPEAVALEFEGSQWSFRALNERANQLAHYLRGMGVGPESFVGVCLERSPEAVLGLLGILKAGAAFVPLDPGYPHNRLAFMIEDAQISLVISRRKWLSVAGVNGSPVVCLDSDHSLIEAQKSENLPRMGRPAGVAYLLYTSGSTGSPKGVLGLHRGAVNRFAWMWKNFPFASGEVCCQKTSFNFVDSIWEVFGPLLQGIPNVIISEHVVRDPAKLVGTLASHGVTRIVTVPSLLRATLDRYPDLGDRLPSLKLWVSSGEALLPDLCRRFYVAMPNATLLNLYGSTEVAADVTAHVARPGPDDQGTVPLGRPIDNTQVYVLDARLQPVPIGVPGDLYVGGAGLARGYYNRPELTAEKFIDDPFSSDTNSRLFRTGDLARYRNDGTLEFLGRRDQQVKIRGFRIELGEIESVLRAHPGVRDTVVVVREEGEKQLVAYVARAGEPPATTAELRDYLKQKLPDYMVPAAWVALPALPLTPNGKVDRRALPPPGADAVAELRAVYAAPDSETEEKIAAIWQDVLGVAKVGRNDNFFDLGGHSLLLTRVHGQLRQAFDKDITMVDLFRYTTVRALAQYLTGHADSIVTEGGQPRGEVRKDVIQRHRQLRRHLASELLKESFEHGPKN
jgi:amino acid adenylation domain-containing protein